MQEKRKLFALKKFPYNLKLSKFGYLMRDPVRE